MQKLPLFPLNTVLFPGATLPLYIFEERYQIMINDCLNTGSPFGVVLIQTGSEVGGSATFHPVGTTAEIIKSERMNEGRLLLHTQGQKRFRVEGYEQQMPYITAYISYLPDYLDAKSFALEQSIQALYRHYWESVSYVTGQDYPIEQLDHDPVEMSFQLCHRLQVDNLTKQHWLATDAATRLREISTVLRRELALLPNLPPRRNQDGRSSNGMLN
jgi:Lon protease-like protein